MMTAVERARKLVKLDEDLKTLREARSSLYTKQGPVTLEGDRHYNSCGFVWPDFKLTVDREVFGAFLDQLVKAKKQEMEPYLI